MIGNRLKRMREERGLKQEQVAKHLNVTRGAVGHWEQGKNEPSYHLLLEMARLYNTSTAYLIGEIDDPTPLYDAIGQSQRDAMVMFPEGWDELTLRQKHQLGRLTAGIRKLLVADMVKEQRK